MNGLIEDLTEINRRLSFKLWNLRDVGDRPHGLSPRMLLPRKKADDRRIGEQEPLILCCGLLNTLNYYYLIENPTEENASSDLNLYIYAGDGFHKVAGVEFKAHNPREEIIRKDVEKVVNSGVPICWFHVLEDIDKDTFHSLFQKLVSSLSDCTHMVGDSRVSMLFCFCVLDKKWTCLKHFFYDASRGDFNAYVDNFFDLDWVLESDHIVVSKGIDWFIFQMNPESFVE